MVELGSEHLYPLSHLDDLLLDILIVFFFSLKIGQIVSHGVSHI